MSETVYFVYGNHGPAPHQLDDLLSLCSELIPQVLGNQLLVSEEPKPGALNILVECFDPQFVARIQSIKAESPSTRFVCIATEFVTGSTFNDFSGENLGQPSKSMTENLRMGTGRAIARLVQQQPRDFLSKNFGGIYRALRSTYFRVFGRNVHKFAKTHYEQWEYWQRRFHCFAQLVPMFDVILPVTLHQTAAYEAAFPNSLVRTLPVFPIRNHAVDEVRDRDIDFFFSGTMTTYRRQMIAKLEDRGHAVVVAPPSLPSSIRLNYLRRSKVCLHIKLREDWPYPSNLRLHQLLSQGKTVVVESARHTCWQERFCRLVPSSSFVEACESALRGAESESSILALYQEASRADLDHSLNLLRSSLLPASAETVPDRTKNHPMSG